MTPREPADWQPDPRTLEWAADYGRHYDPATRGWLLQLAAWLRAGRPDRPVETVYARRRRLAQEATR